MSNCPHCQRAIDDTVPECPGCGVLFNKWKEREENVATGNLTRYSAIANATSQSFNWTILVVIAIAVAGVLYIMGQKALEQ